MLYKTAKLYPRNYNTNTEKIRDIPFKPGALPYLIEPYITWTEGNYIYFITEMGPYQSKYVKSITLRNYELDVRINPWTHPDLISGADKWLPEWSRYSTFHNYYNRIYHVYRDQIIRETTYKHTSVTQSYRAIRTKHHLIITNKRININDQADTESSIQSEPDE